MSIACGFANEVNQFVCAIAANEENLSLFLFDRPTNGEVVGNFEFCAQSGIEDCVTELVQSPDGIVALVISSPLATLTASTRQTPESSSESLVPYLQYLEQGSASIDSIGIARDTDDRVAAMVNALEHINMIAAEY
jgi:hypothetical protein